MSASGIETIAVDRYPDAPAMQVAHRAHVINMLHGESLRALIEQEKPDYIVPEIEAIATDTLVELEQAGQKVVPTARAAKLTMNREGIRRWRRKSCSFPLPAIVLPTAKKASARGYRDRFAMHR
ncbi:phosphoribosylglycinamide formyltransferase [Klebsiella pneumoniae]|nr:phosphoribosylglycinamide formyltransferase [Klebsiella pneumoniae]